MNSWVGMLRSNGNPGKQYCAKGNSADFSKTVDYLDRLAAWNTTDDDRFITGWSDAVVNSFPLGGVRYRNLEKRALRKGLG